MPSFSRRRYGRRPSVLRQALDFLETRVWSPRRDPTPPQYLASGMCIAALLGTVTLTAPAVGRSVAASMCASSGRCPGTVSAGASLGRCRVVTHAEAVRDDALVFSERLGTSGRFTLSRTVDKDAVVHWFVREDGGTAARAQAGRQRGSSQVVDFSQVVEFASEQAARHYLRAAAHRPLKDRLREVDAVGAVLLFGDAVDGHDTGAPSYGAESYVTDGGGAAQLTAETRAAMGGTPSGGIDGLVSTSVPGSAQADGSVVALRLARGVGSALGLLAPESQVLGQDSGQDSGQVMATVRTDGAGYPQRLDIEVAGPLSEGLSHAVAEAPTRTPTRTATRTATREAPLSVPQLDPTHPGPPEPSPKRPALPSPTTDLGTLLLQTPPPTTSGDVYVPRLGQVRLTVDLSDPIRTGTVAEVLHRLQVPLLQGVTAPPAPIPPKRGPGPPAPAADPVRAAMAAYLALFEAGGGGTSVTVNTFRTTGGPETVPRTEPGPMGGLTLTHTLPADSYYYSPGNGFVRWQECEA